jgi:sugar/nucleoside kinase (ribokinase family)
MTFDSSHKLLRFVLAGSLNRDYILPISGPAQINVLGGNLSYAAMGLHLWGETAGLVARVGQDYPLVWLERIEKLGFDLSGIKVLNQSIDSRRFMAHTDASTTHLQNPVQHFAERGLIFPPDLLGYRPNIKDHCSRTEPLPNTIQISDIPGSYLDASAVHICPMDYLSHLILPSVFRQGHASNITLSSTPGYMDPSFREEIPGLLSEITAFITTEQEIRNLFQGRETDLWQMAVNLGEFGPEYVIIHTRSLGYFLYDRERNKRWAVPDYQSKKADPTGAGDAFGGAFLAGYRELYDPLEAAVMGSIAASVVSEGSGVYYAVDTMPDLIKARQRALRELVREI